jgi:predicted nucleotidyltransferase
MQALSSYSPDFQSVIETALLALANDSEGLAARPYFSERGLFAKFIWPDWPSSRRKELAAVVEDLHSEHPELIRLPESAPEWNAVFRDWRSHPESADAIANAFVQRFGNDRVRWVESEKDARGRIASQCWLDGIGQITLHLFWRDSYAVPAYPFLSDDDRKAFNESVQTVFAWARQRIRPILDTLYDQLRTLYGDRFRGLYVFGSYARPDAGIKLPEDSDLDVALLLSNYESGYKEMDRCGSIVSDLSLKHRLIISLVPLLEADFREGRTNFSRVISEYAISVSPNDEGDGSVLAESAAISKGQ